MRKGEGILPAVKHTSCVFTRRRVLNYTQYGDMWRICCHFFIKKIGTLVHIKENVKKSRSAMK